MATIKRIQCVPIDGFNKMTSGCKIYLVLNRGGLACTNFEEAIATKEVVVKANLEDMASDAAIQELKKWKEKLDLQIITQEEYDAKKAESKYLWKKRRKVPPIACSLSDRCSSYSVS